MTAINPAEVPMTEGLDPMGRLEVLYRAEHPGLFHLALLLTGDHAVAQELAQEAFVRLAPQLDRTTNPGGYLRTTVVNLCRDHGRRQTTVHRHPDAPPGTKRRRSRHLLAAAAIVAAVSGLAASIVIATGRHDGPEVRTGAAPAADPPATGWYVPEGLPAGWTLDEVVMMRTDEDCPCRTAAWVDEDRSTSITLHRWRVPPGTTSPPADQMGETPAPVDLGAVEGARVAQMDDGWYLEWYDGEAAFGVRRSASSSPASTDPKPRPSAGRSWPTRIAPLLPWPGCPW